MSSVASEKLCFVEDDPTIRELVAEKLNERGYAVELLDSAEPLMEKELSNAELSDLYILDIRLRGSASGLELCKRLRETHPSLPILILSALSEPSDRIEGLKMGADDYLTKPFEMEELLLRIHGMLRRRSWYGNFPAQSPVYTWDGNSVNFETYEGRRGYESFTMSQKECMLLKLLIEKEEQVVSRDEILDRVWGYNVFPSSRTVDNFIMRLRRYYEREPKLPKYIHSVRGLGYRFCAKGKA